MPHKKAKRSTREQARKQTGSDLPPPMKNLASEGIPKSVARILNAASVRAEWHAKKRKSEEEEGKNRKKRRMDQESEKKGKKETTLTIKPGESLAHFNRRVEDDMRPLVRSAMATSSVVARKAKNGSDTNNAQSRRPKGNEQMSEASIAITEVIAANKSQDVDDDERMDRGRKRPKDPPKDFERTSSSAPKRLNDVAQAPPELRELPQRITREGSRGWDPREGKAKGVLSMAQRALMEAEREKAIQRYRQLKEQKMKTRHEGKHNA
ncbi:hypothetical protein PUNSTDRAFT_50095 [Punctularia strigosozonata HHB-11173 SS5]|uniref:uncharacterized protein n=1 Tax=Punctularia strigosozonata (strain HHB-11173) TaxID=741275 RepID=UPI00044162F3|nr:uncharacterized protein PUNSTDRAFT_50095 [Punctularia strigosozonata HHB-11173 SS5]EIN12868.1 hypothetical protein PUNSTDRAFT_50095 [Punctularia strigosozonata HHB-11173 SS5]